MIIKTWFVSDTHFGHHNIIKFCDRPFRNVEVMNEILIKKWNDLVQPQDIVWHLGDISMKIGNEELMKILQKLNGRKRLIIGNHDKSSIGFYNKYFEAVMLAASIKIGKHIVHLSHYPYNVKVLGQSRDLDKRHNQKYDNKRLEDDGRFLIHGHVHNNKGKKHGNMINVSCDVWDYAPVSLSQIEKLLKE